MLLAISHLLLMPPLLTFKWNRLRAALFALIKKSAISDVSVQGAAILVACVSSECESIRHQCCAGPESISAIFVENVVSPDSVPAGLFVRAIADVLQSDNDARTNNHVVVRTNCVQALTALKGPILETISLPCPDPCNGAFVDPRPTLTEAWLQAMLALASAMSVCPSVEGLLTETCVIMVTLLFNPSMGKLINERMSDPGMSLDGPQSLALTAFFCAFFRLGAGALQSAGQRLIEIVPVDLEPMTGHERSFQGIAVLGAALFRASAGALPPWAVESIPEVYSSLFDALGEDVEAFGRVMQLSMELRMSETESGLGGVAAGRHLSGRIFETISDKAKSAFIDEAKEISRMGGAASWRRLKGLIKQACGGKKKDTDFNQKPSPTRWEFERV